MKFSVSSASVLLVILALPLLGVKPGSAGRDLARFSFTPANGARPDITGSGLAQSPITTIYPTFTTIDVPGAGVTEVSGINAAGEMVGLYGKTDYDAHQRGFLLKNGKFIHVDYPKAYTTLAFGINDAGIVVGSAGLKDRTVYVGFTYDGATFTPLRDGSDSATCSYSINDANNIVGGAGTVYGSKGFLESNGIYTPINFPGVNVYEYATNINNLGEIVGLTDYDAYTYINGQFQNIDVPGASQTGAFGINDQGIISGYYFLDPAAHGFALFKGKYVSFSFPGATETTATGINAAGNIVGAYDLADGTVHGFVTSPITAADFQ